MPGMCLLPKQGRVFNDMKRGVGMLKVDIVTALKDVIADQRAEDRLNIITLRSHYTCIIDDLETLCKAKTKDLKKARQEIKKLEKRLNKMVPKPKAKAKAAIIKRPANK